MDIGFSRSVPFNKGKAMPGLNPYSNGYWFFSRNAGHARLKNK